MLLIVAAAFVWGGCSVEKNYELLSFFFDGVPEPGADGLGGAGARSARGGARPGAAVSRHSAYVDRRCAECHGDRAAYGFSTTGFGALDESICLRCHEDVTANRAWMHGPVSSGACLECHEAHASTFPWLLRESGPDLCLRCHDPSSGTEVDGPAHADLTRDCLECHFGHGGDEPSFLRPSEPAAPEAEDDRADAPAAS